MTRTKALLPVRGSNGRYSDELPPEVAREIARGIRAGELYDSISARLGISRATGRRKCAKVAAALGVAIEERPHVLFAREVAALAQEGLTDVEIGKRLGRTVGSVQAARQRAIGTKYRVVRLTAEEHATIDRMIRGGFNQHEIAREVGCHQTLVSTRAKRLHGSPIQPVRAPCACGKPAGHGGRCNLVVEPAHIRQRLLDGFTASDIAREFDRTSGNFKTKYVQPVVDQLTAEGIVCACGQPFGHRFACPATMARLRRQFTAEQRDQARDLVRGGASVDLVRKALAITVGAGNVLVGEVRAELAAAGERCPCGMPIDHARSCAVRNGTQGTKRTSFRFTSAAAAKMTPERRRAISKLARIGHPVKVICDRTGESEWRVDQLVFELRTAGLTPEKCATCENPFNHKGPCVLPKRCQCGRWRNHRGPCRKKGTKRTVANGGKPPSIAPALRREAMIRYRDGESNHRISAAIGVPLSQVQRLVAYWRDRSKFQQKPCICGRPARHPGGCIKNTPGAVGKLERARIVDAIRGGELPHVVADRLGMHVQTVLKHSAATRDAMFAEGITCSCGRPVHHPYWCSAKWDALDQPRGRRPFAEPHETRATEALIRGDVVADIARAAGVGTDSVWRLRRALTDEQRAARTKAIRERIARGGHGGGEAIMALVRVGVPRGLETAVRDDIEAEIYLAVIEGRIEAEQIRSVARSFVSRGLSQWQSAYGPASLDAAIGADDRRTRGDMIEDNTALGEIDSIIIGSGG